MLSSLTLVLGERSTTAASETAKSAEDGPDGNHHAPLENILPIPESLLAESIVINETACDALGSGNEDSKGDEPSEASAASNALEAAEQWEARVVGNAESRSNDGRLNCDGVDANLPEFFRNVPVGLIGHIRTKCTNPVAICFLISAALSGQVKRLIQDGELICVETNDNGAVNEAQASHSSPLLRVSLLHLGVIGLVVHFLSKLIIHI